MSHVAEFGATRKALRFEEVGLGLRAWGVGLRVCGCQHETRTLSRKSCTLAVSSIGLSQLSQARRVSKAMEPEGVRRNLHSVGWFSLLAGVR